MATALTPPGTGSVGRTAWPWRLGGLLVAVAVWGAGFALWYDGGASMWEWGRDFEEGVDSGLRLADVALGMVLGMAMLPAAGIPLGVGFGIRRFGDVPQVLDRLGRSLWGVAAIVVLAFAATATMSLLYIGSWQDDVLAGRAGLEAFGRYENVAVGLGMLVPFVVAVPVARATMLKMAADPIHYEHNNPS